MCAILVSERFRVQPDQLRHMTVTRFWLVYNHPKKDDGTLKRYSRGRQTYKSEKQEFLEWGESHRYPLWLIRQKWFEQIDKRKKAEEAAKAEAKQNRRDKRRRKE